MYTLQSVAKVLTTAVTAFAALAQAKPAFGSGEILVIGDNATEPPQYSEYFNALRNHSSITLKFASIRDKSLDLISDDGVEYENVIILPVSSKALGPKLKASNLVQYYNAGGNILAFTSENSSPESLFEFFKELDINISPKDYKAVDHFSYSKSKSSYKHDTLELSAASDFVADRIVKAPASKPLIYRGSGAYLGNNPNTIPILRGSSTSYVYDSSDDSLALTSPWVSGTQSTFAAAFQGLNNARAVWIGSDETLLDNKYLQDKNLYNAEFIDEVSKWVFQEKSVIRNTFVAHEPADNNTAKATSYTSGFSLYKVNEDVRYTAGVQEWVNDKWVPYVADDIQVEFVMLDPYYRINLGKPTAETPEQGAIYTVTFKVPDQYGIFTFKLDYKRPGLSYLEKRNTVTVRHTANDEWPRSWEITNSWIYFFSFASVVGAWVIFVVFYFYTDNGAPFSETVKKFE
ncbi:uncharacterized protein SAPINGB_P001235 [Magnusiomyces paraingens]|uniref:Dolichyl-diphosphooligosaccharide--protein glycosyltransferase subunit WBP1 n=1 Tax=Magnusiomyces paraingens TaxID=2606893 RepID=A0A5E8B4N2_9ASCO|nr:uncharacterized protein SAPINGB_P001235 [Saprochaete ingens]VVT46482.1 unnamed protein product [Saprochaete ingens]